MCKSHWSCFMFHLPLYWFVYQNFYLEEAQKYSSPHSAGCIIGFELMKLEYMQVFSCHYLFLISCSWVQCFGLARRCFRKESVLGKGFWPSLSPSSHHLKTWCYAAAILESGVWSCLSHGWGDGQKPFSSALIILYNSGLWPQQLKAGVFLVASWVPWGVRNWLHSSRHEGNSGKSLTLLTSMDRVWSLNPQRHQETWTKGQIPEPCPGTAESSMLGVRPSSVL